MARFYVSFKRMMKRFAVPLKVYGPTDKPRKIQNDVGEWVDNPDADSAPEERSEPVVANTGTLADLIEGGTYSDTDLLWISNKLYPDNTVVDVPSHGGKFRVQRVHNYLDYSDVVIYELKGDSLNGISKSRADSTNAQTTGGTDSKVPFGGSLSD